MIRAMGCCPYADQLRLADVQPQLDIAAKFGIIPRRMSAELVVR